MTFDQKIRMGTAGELVVENLQLAHGYYTQRIKGSNPEHLFRGAQFKTTQGTQHTAIDLLRFSKDGGAPEWCEVKTKRVTTESKWHPGVMETGCDHDKFDHYSIIDYKTRLRCSLYFLQLRAEPPARIGYSSALCPTGLYRANVHLLHTTKRQHKCKAENMIYWELDVFERVATIAELYDIAACAKHLDAAYNIVGRDKDHPPPEPLIVPATPHMPTLRPHDAQMRLL